MSEQLIDTCDFMKAGKLYRVKHHRRAYNPKREYGQKDKFIEKNDIVLFLGRDAHVDVSEYKMYFLCKDSTTQSFPIGMDWLYDYFEPI